ncbi:MAG: hypothetical protein R2873_19615 [Caldilineaceae bacterium]
MSREFRAVDEASFQIDLTKPEIFTIAGESGSGKTTLARMFLGVGDAHPRRPPLQRTLGGRSQRKGQAQLVFSRKCSPSSRTRSPPSACLAHRSLSLRDRFQLQMADRRNVDAYIDQMLTEAGLTLAGDQRTLPSTSAGRAGVAAWGHRPLAAHALS